MKAILILLIISISAIRGFTQEFDSAALATLTPSVRSEVEAHLAIARKAKHAAKGFLIGGAALQLGSLGIALAVNTEEAAYYAFLPLSLGHHSLLPPYLFTIMQEWNVQKPAC